MPELFQKTVLPSGVRIITETIPSVRSVSVGAWVAVGSRDESAANGGICHFIEHMVFKGTTNRRMHHIAQRMENVGGYLNAFTSKEFTCYYARCLDEHLARALDTVIDLVANPVFPEKELEREKDVVVEEMRMYEDTPDERVFDLLDGALYGSHAMGRPVIGTEKTVRSFTKRKLSDFVDKNYTAKNLVIAVAGNVEHTKTVRMIERFLEGFQTNRKVKGRRRVSDYKPGEVTDKRPMQQAHIILGTRGLDVHDPSRISLSVLNTVLGGGMSSRLNQNIREKYGYCYNIFSFANMHSDTGDFGVYMGTDAKKVDHSLKLIRKEIDRLAQKQISKTELARAKSQAKGAIMLGLESMGSRMMRIGRQELYYERYYTLDEILDLLNDVSLEDITRTAGDILKSNRFSEIRLLPTEA